MHFTGNIFMPSMLRILQKYEFWTLFVNTYVALRGKSEVHTGFWWGDLREGDHLGDPGVDWRIILKRIFKK
jgi:hypothetical protein